MSRWPKDNQTALIAFYGNPGTGETGRQLVKIKPPFRMYYDGRLLNTLSFHKKAAPALLSALTKVWDYYDRDQGKIDKLGMSKTAGTFNPRMVRGSKTKWSNHAYGAAIDINAEQNGFNVVGNIPPVMIAAFKSEGAAWGGDYKTRPDPMHFEFCDRGEPARTFEQWLKVLGVKPKAKAVPMMDMDFAERVPKADIPDHIEEDFAEPEAPPIPIATPLPPKAVPTAPPPANPAVQGDPELWNVQRRLKAMAYNPGGLDGIWGGQSSGAISAFLNDRQSIINPPTSIDDFHKAQERLKSEISKAEGERFTRPIAPERATATEAVIATKAPEIVPVQQNKLAAFWGAITAGFFAFWNFMADRYQDALSYLAQFKDYLALVPAWAWLVVAAGVLAYFALNSKRGAEGIAESYRKGERS